MYGIILIWKRGIVMKIAIVYKSLTGNTKIIAKSIKEALQKQNIIYFGEPKDNIDADVYIVGSWTDKGDATEEIKNFLLSLENKKIAYFGTAGFGGSSEYYIKLFNRVKNYIKNSNKIIGYFYCQGKMPEKIRQKYEQLIKEHPDDRNIKISIDNFDKALTHPDLNDIKNAKIWIKSILEV